jgi:hypothetical protein
MADEASSNLERAAKPKVEKTPEKSTIKDEEPKADAEDEKNI